MIELFSETEFIQAKSRSRLPMRCEACSKTFQAEKREVQWARVDQSISRLRFCSRSCFGKSQNTSLQVKCDRCKKPFIKKLAQIKSTRGNFCSKSCAATYHNRRRSHSRRSTIEERIQGGLVQRFPNLEIFYNDKSALDTEVDIWIPSLHLAFEIHGVHHSQAIYGPERLLSMGLNDQYKMLLANLRSIRLVSLNLSMINYFTAKELEITLQYIGDMIRAVSEYVNCQRTKEAEGLEPPEHT